MTAKVRYERRKSAATLMISLLVGGTWLLRGEAASADQIEDGSNPETEFLEEETENSDSEIQKNDSSQEILDEKETPEVKGLTYLQIPEKLEIVIDP